MKAREKQGRSTELLFVKLGQIIHEKRVKQGFSQEELAKKVGLHRTYISDIERGRRNVTITVLFSLADGLGITPVRLLQLLEQKE